MRFTKLNSDGKYITDENKIEEAIQKLAVFENMLDKFTEDMNKLPERLEKLKAAKKEKTVAYKELVTQKLINTNILMFFKRNGINLNN